VVILVALERWRPWRADLGSDVDGNLEAPAAVAPHGRIVPAE
jgi:hypothetical protein